MISIKSPREIELMRETCDLAKQTLEFIEPFVKAGVSTLEINDLCHDFIVKHGAVPSPLNYHGFPKSICTSINNVICHGIPNKKSVLCDGDIINIDITTFFKNFHGDTSKTFLIGNVSDEVRKLVDITYLCMMEGIREVRPGANIGNIGAIIQEIAHDNNYSVVEDYCGHGIGREFHEPPQIVHIGKRGQGPEIKEGMTFTIEPMLNMGKKYSKVLKDNWTVITKDKKLSAQFEHTVLVTKDGFDILTLRDEEKNETTL